MLPPPLVAVPAGDQSLGTSNGPRIVQGTYVNGTIVVQGERLDDGELHVQNAQRRDLAITLTNRSSNSIVGFLDISSDPGLLWVWVADRYGRSANLRLNAAEPRWLAPARPKAGDQIRILGTNLARGGAAYVSIRPTGALSADEAIALTPARVTDYELTVDLPVELNPNLKYQVWVNNGSGDADGWSGPLDLEFDTPEKSKLGAKRLYAGVTYDIRSYGARCDGSDDSGAVTAAINAMGNGDTLLFSCQVGIGAAGIRIANKSNITVAGTGGTTGIKVLAQPTQGMQGFGHVSFLVQYCATCTIRDLFFDGNGVNASVFGIDRSTNSSVSNLTIVNVGTPINTFFSEGAAAAMVATGNTSNLYQNITIVNTARWPDGNGMRGMWIGNETTSEYENYATITGNTIRNSGFTGIVLEGVGGTITNNLTELTGCAGIKVVPAPGATTTTIDSNIARQNLCHGIQIDRGHDMVVSNNILEANTQAGLYTVGTFDNSSVTGNIARDNQSSNFAAGLTVQGGNNITISNNRSLDTRSGGARTQRIGLTLNPGAGFPISGFTVTNNIFDNNTDFGLTLSPLYAGISNGVISNNTFTRNGNYGIGGGAGYPITNVSVTDNMFAANTTGAALNITPTSSNGYSAPAVTIGAPLDGSTVQGVVNVTATATDAQGIARVDFYVDGILAGSATATPYGFSWNTATLSNGSHVITAKASDGATSIASHSVAVTVQNATSSDPFITGVTAGTPRNDFTGFVGMRITVGSTPLIVTQLGRYVLTGNRDQHTVKIFQASNGAEVASASVPTIGTPVGLFAYAPIGAITLQANTSYYVASQESAGGDSWFNSDAQVASTSAGSVNSGAYFNASWITTGLPGRTFVPVNFKYSLTGSGDQQPPTASISSPAAGAQLSSSVNIDASVSDNVGVITVEFYVDGVLKFTDVNAPFSYTWDTTKAGNGSHTLLVKAFDAAGNYGLSAPVSVTVQNVATSTAFVDSTTLGTARNDFSGWVGFKMTVGANPITVTSLGRWVASGNTQAHTVKIVQVSNGADVAGASASVATGNLPQGQYGFVTLGSPVTLAANTSYYVVSQEFGGGDTWYNSDTSAITAADGVMNNAVYLNGGSWFNTGVQNRMFVPVNFKYTLGVANADTAPPTVTITNPANSTVVSGLVEFRSSASDNTGVTKVEYFVDNVLRGASTAGNPYSVSFDTRQVANGTRTVLARASDAAGNTGTHVISISVQNVADTTPPTVSITGPASQATVSGATVPVAATATDESSVTRVDFYVDGSLASSSSTSPYGFTWDTTQLANGNHTIEARAFDPSNNMGTASVTVNVQNAAASGTNFITAVQAGTPRNDYSGFLGSGVTIGSNPLTVVALGRLVLSGNSRSHTVKIVLASTGADVPGSSVSVPTAGVTPGQFAFANLPAPVTLLANTAYYFVSDEAAAGDTWYNQDAVVTTTNVATVNNGVYWSGSAWVTTGVQNRAFVPVNFRYGTGSTGGGSTGGGTTTPTPPTVLLTAPTQGTTVSGQVNITASASDTTGISRVEFLVDSALRGTATSGANGVYSYSWSTTSESNGTHTIQARAYNTSGLSTTSASISVTVSNTATGGGTGGGTGGTSTTGTAFVTTQKLGTPRSDFAGWVGMRVAIGASPVTVSAIGRYKTSGNGAAHTMKFVSASTGLDVAGGSAQISMANGSAGQYVYTNLTSPITLAANTTYYLVCLESAAGDAWYDANTVLTTTTDATVVGSVYYNGLSYSAFGVQNQAFGPYNFLYSTGGGSASNGGGSTGDTVPPAVTVSVPPSVSGTVTLTATASDNVGVTRVDYLVDNNVVGSATASPYSVSWNSATVPNGSHTVTARAWDAAGNSGNSSVTVTVSNTTTVNEIAFITGVTAGTARNDYSGYVGMRFTTGPSAVTVTSLGRYMITGNTRSHILKLVQASNGQDVPGGSVTVTMTGGTPGQFKYLPLPIPVTLTANTTYYLVSQESVSGDQWYDLNTIVTTTGAANINSGVYGGAGSYWTPGIPNRIYVPVSFKYQ